MRGGRFALCHLAGWLVLVAAMPLCAQTQPVSTPPAKPSIFDFSDTQISYWYEFSASEPGITSRIGKNIFSITHNDAWTYGTNFLNFEFLLSDQNDPQAPYGGPGFPIPPGGINPGAFEVYGIYRGTLSFSQLTKTESLKVGPIGDLSLYFGGDFNSKNTAFAPRKLAFVAGLQLSFDVPGYFNVAAMLYKEWNYNGIVPLLGNPPGMSEYVNFSATAAFEAQYMQPLSFTGVPLRFSGFTNVVLPKGTDGFGVPTITELLTDNRLTLDLGKFVADRPNLFDIFVGYRFWLNKFGNNPYPASGPPVPGTLESTFYVGVAWHIF